MMVVVSIVGVLAGLATTGVRKYLDASKTAEARLMIGAIGRGAVGAFERERTDNQILLPGAKSTTVTNSLCESATPVPSTVPKNTKYTPNSSGTNDFNSGDGKTGWPCLHFTISSPIYYRYQYRKGSGYVVATASNTASKDFEVSAQGDIDGDGILSTFALNGAVTSTNNVVISTALYVNQEYE